MKIKCFLSKFQATILHVMAFSAFFAVQSATVSGNITDKATGLPIENAKLIFRYGIYSGGGAMETEWESTGNTHTDISGSYTFDVEASKDTSQTYQIIVSHENYSGTTIKVNIFRDTVINFSFDEKVFCPFSVCVYSKDSLPLKGAHVAANLLVNDGDIYFGTTDETGCISFPKVTSGEYAISASMDSYETSSSAMIITVTGSQQSFYLAKGETYSLSGKLTDPSGNIISDALLVLKLGGKSDRTTIIAVSGSDGAYSFTGIPTDAAAEYEAKIEIEAEGYQFEDYRINISEDDAVLDMQGSASSSVKYSSLRSKSTLSISEISFSACNSVSFNIAFSGKNIKVSIYTLDGRQLAWSPVKPGHNTVNLHGNISAGIVMLILHDENRIIESKSFFNMF